MHDAGEGETAATDSVAETLPQTGSGAANPLIQDNDGDEDDENGQAAWSKYEALKAKATTLSAVEMDALAQWKWLNGRLGEAIDSYLELARAHPKYLHVHFKLGYLYLILQNYESAIQHLTLEMDKQAHLPPLTNVRRAKILARKAYFWCSAAGRMEAHHCLKHADKQALDERLAASDGGSSTEGLVAMGCLYRQLGLLQRAESCFDQASQLKPNDPSYLVEYGKLLLLQRRPAPALGKFSDCRRVAPALSEDLFQAMLGEAVANMRLQKPSAAQSILQKIIDSLSPMVEQGLAPLMMNSEMDRMTIRQILHQAIHCQGCCAILQGDIQGALDVYYTVVAEFADFQLPVMCVTPGARDAKGHLVDTAMFSTDRIVDLLLYLDEIELRYGPDACLYFHRANVYRALGDLKSFIDDLTMVESLNPVFLRHYLDHDCFGDFLDEETMTWIPLDMLESICELTKPVLPGVAPPATVFIEAAVHQYFETRLHYDHDGDLYAQVFAIDSLRRLDLHEEVPLAMHRLRQGTGISFDDSLCHLHPSDASPTAKSRIEALVKSHPSNPTVHFVAALVHMSELRLDRAHHHLTQCVQEINKVLNKMNEAWKVQGQEAASATDAVARWSFLGHVRAKYHALVWRSVVLQLNLHANEAVGDMRAAMALLPTEPHAMFVKACMMVHYGQLANAIAPLREGFACLRRDGRAKNLAVCMDYIRFAGMNSFSLLPQELKREGPDPREPDDDDDRLRRQNASADTRGGTVLYANALDKLYEAGVLKLSKGHIRGALQYFESIVSIKDSYVSPAIHAMLDLHKCKDSRVVDEKVFACHQQLSHRAVRFHEVTSLPFEGFKDMSACIAYYPHDMDMYWYRGHLHRRYHNYSAAIDDFTSCILLTLHLGKPKGAHLHRYKKMVLARATMYVHEMQWELALDDLNEVLHYALRDTQVEASFLLHVYDKRSKVLVALKQYDAAIVEMETVLALSKDHIEWNDNSLLNMLLLANLHCHAAIEYQKRHHAGMYTTFLFPTKASGADPSLHLPATTSLRKAHEYYNQVLDQRPTFPLALFLKGRMHALLGENSMALDMWTKCLRQDAKFLVANFLKGSLRAQQCLPDLALAEFLTIRNQLPEYPHVQMSIGYCYYLQGNVKRAVVELTEALAQNPADVDAWYTRGVCLQELLALSSAIADFGRAVALQPTHWRAWYQRGMCHLLLKDYTSALLDFGKAAPHLRDGYAAIGYVYFCRDMFLEASQAYSRCLDERTNDAKILLYRGFSHYRHGERTLAMRDFEKALKIDSSCWFGHFIKAYVHQEEGHGDKAMASIALCMDHFKHVRPFAEIILPVHADRANPFFHGRLDATLEKLKGLALPQPSQGSAGPLTTGRPASNLDRMQWQEIHVWWLAIVANRAHLRATFAKAVRRVLFQSRVVLALEKFAVQATLASITLSKQIDKLTEMQVIAPPQGTFSPGAVAWAYNLVGVLSATHAKWDDALRNFTMAIRAAPTKPIPHLNRGNVYMQMNAIEKALHEFREALKVDPAHVATLTNAALALRQLSQLEESCRQLYAAVGTQDVAPAALAHVPPHHQQLLYYALANVVRELNRNDEAIEWYTKAAMIETSDHVHLAVRHNRGATMHAQRKFQRALDDYSVALSLQPQSFETRMNRAAVYITTSKCFDALQDLRVAASLQRDSAACSRLLRFCDRWTSALKVACYDFLYAFSAVPCFQDVDITSAAPLFDNYMFRFEHLSHPNHPSRRALEAMLDATDSPDLPDLLYDALMHIQQGSYADAQRALLIAKYSSHISVHEEQACLVWSAQISHHLGDTPAAIAAMEQALQRGPVLSSSSSTVVPLDEDDMNEAPGSTSDDILIQNSMRSDMETYLGCLLRHQGRTADATTAFENAIRLGPANAIALFNAASIYHHNGDYSSMLDMLHKIFSVMVAALDVLEKTPQPSPGLKDGAPLLYMPRDLATTFPRLPVLATSTALPICRAIQTVMNEYRGNLTCDVAKHVSHLCVLQGQLATHVEALRDAVKPAPDTAATARTPPLLQSAESSRSLVRNSVSGSRRNILRRSSARRLWKPEEVATLNLADFNAAIAKCTAEMIQRPDVPVNDDVLADYVAQYDRVCAFINTASAPNAPVSPLTRDYSRAMLCRDGSMSSGLSRSGSVTGTAMATMLTRHGPTSARALVARDETSSDAPTKGPLGAAYDNAAASPTTFHSTTSSFMPQGSSIAE
ncbi:hypothetical protein, variant [Aphanomyces invadans]|uniref:UDP-N-acetylglucosamine--peptide N-acetylglucosaminyltransferase SPINDLY n=1 Tax=Aphanomyces invadans TaxID=157072 RepID=A0A024TM20_9STRA|nr:hypothetical protein, variant [Aphanomyces invadans]ETV95034.1 hypothetical protein, variant [Aphanomyces invadans]|eukprot:XP_008876206.1 hypothetical protein, variant [Aphanomyces invadans]